MRVTRTILFTNVTMLKPLRGYVLVEQLDDELKTSSGLVLPETAKDKPIKGVVLAVGESSVIQGKINDEFVWLQPTVKAGDKVVYKRWSTTDLEEDGKKLSFVAFQDILGVYE